MTPTPIEEWRPIDFTQGAYLVSNLGRVMRAGGKVLKIDLADRGIPKIRIGAPGERKKTLRVTAIVATAFLGPRPDGLSVCHRDHNLQNCAAANLEYGMPQPLRGAESRTANLTADQVLAIAQAPGSHAAAARAAGISPSHASRIRRGVAWRHLSDLTQLPSPHRRA